jgi:hypothetical protein
MGAIVVKVGVMTALIVMVVVAVTPGQPPLAAIAYVTVYGPAVLVEGVIAPVVLLIVKPAGNAL